MQRTTKVIEAFFGRTPCAAGVVWWHVDHQPFDVRDLTSELLGPIGLLAGHAVSVRTSPTMTMVRSTTAIRMNTE